jgi:glyoxylase-like metal-dependent hydrolase (beta-lactamase superfamily II)
MHQIDAVHPLRLEYDFPDRDDLPARRLVIHPAAVETEDGVILVDTGVQGSVDRLEAQLSEVGLDLADVSTVLLTHHDWDHAGSAAAVADETDATVVAPRREANYIDGRDHPIKADEDRYPPTTVHVEILDGVVFHTDAGEMHVVGTPGHTPGHVSLYFPDHRLLLAADALTSDEGLAGPKAQFTIDMEEAARSVGTLAEYDVEHVLCYHGGPVEITDVSIADVHEAMTA